MAIFYNCIHWRVCALPCPLDVEECRHFKAENFDYAHDDIVKVIRCEKCKYWTKQDMSIQGRCALSGTYPTGKWFCANGAKMDEEVE